jgi:hypothetical protein
MRSPSRSVESSMVNRSSLASSGFQEMFLPQARDGGLDPGKRRAQVVADRGQEGRADAVRLCELIGLSRLLRQLLALPGRLAIAASTPSSRRSSAKISGP